MDDKIPVQCISRHRRYLDFATLRYDLVNVSARWRACLRSDSAQGREDVATATGEIWKTTINAGTVLVPLFDKERVISRGDIALARSNPNIIYAGTGEEDSRNSSYCLEIISVPV